MSVKQFAKDFRSVTVALVKLSLADAPIAPVRLSEARQTKTINKPDLS